MATGRKPFIRIETSLLREPWRREEKTTLVMLACSLGDRWARDRLNSEEACRATLSASQIHDITGRANFGTGVAALRALAEHISLEIEVFGATGCVYFVERDGLVKIGQTMNLQRRLGQLRNPEVLAVIPHDEPLKLEKRLHRKFASWCYEGEWFRLDEEFWDAVEDLAADHPGMVREQSGFSPETVRGLSVNVSEADHNNPRVAIYWPKFAKTQELPGRGRESKARAKPESAPAPSQAPAGSNTVDASASQPTDSPKSKRVKKPPPRPWALDLSAHLIKCLTEVPGARIPEGAVTRWAREIERMPNEIPELKLIVMQGGPEALVERIQAGIEDATGPEAMRSDDRKVRQYSPVIKCGRSLREKWPQITAAAARRPPLQQSPEEFARHISEARHG